MKRRVWINSILFILTFIFCFSLASCSMDSTVNKLVSKNGVTVEQGDFESGSVLRAVEIKDETIVSAVKENIALKEYDKTKEIIILDIAVLMNDVRLQPKNTVKISLSKSIDDLNDYVIFHILEDNTVEEITPVVSGGKISFEANSLSYFVIAQKEQKEEVTYKFKALAKTGGKIYHSEILVGEDGFEVLTNEGRNITLTALANPGYEFVGWYGVSVGDYTRIDPISTDLTHTFTVGAEVDGTYAYAVFKAIQKYQFQAVALEGGRITQIGAIIPDTGFECVDYAGTKIPLTAKPNEGYRFLGWYWWNRADYTDIEPISTNPYYEFEVIANPQGAMVFAAFEKVANITLQLDITEGGTVTLDSSPVGESGLTTSIATGKEVLLSATSAEGYTFQGWYEYYESGVYDLRTPLSIGATYSLTIPEKDYHVVAVFRLDITGLIIDGVPGGFASEGVTKVVLGTAESERPNISAVIPYVVTVIGNIRIELSKITISGEIDFTKVGVYTITFSYEDMFIHTPLTATLVVEIVAHSYDLSVQIVNSGFVTMNGVGVPSAGSTIRVREGNTTTLVAQEDIGYTFQGWYEYGGVDADYDTSTPLSTATSFDYIMPGMDKKIMAVFHLDISSIVLDGVPGNFAESGDTTYTIGAEKAPIVDNVLVYGNTVKGKIAIAQSKCTITGVIEITVEGTYTITFSYKEMFKETPLTAKLVVIVEQIPIVSYTGSLDSTGDYNGGCAAYVNYDMFMINSDLSSKVAIGARFTYNWVNADTGDEVSPVVDDTLDDCYFPGPAVAGNYLLNLFFVQSDTAKTFVCSVPRTILADTFEMVTSRDMLGDETMTTNVIASVVDGKMYVMSMPDYERVDRVAYEVPVDENGLITVGNEYAYAFRPYHYMNRTKSYVSGVDGNTYTMLDFRTGDGPYRIGSICLYSDAIILGVNGDSQMTVDFYEDGHAKICAPFLTQGNHDIRMVYDDTLKKYVFTMKDPATDTRTSYPIYIYKEYIKPTPEPEVNSYKLLSSLDKVYDGNPVSVNMYKDVLISNGSNVVDWSSIEKYMGRAIWTDLKGVEISSSYDGMISTGPKEVGTYKFVIQESPDFGKTYTTMLEVEFTIQPAS